MQFFDVKKNKLLANGHRIIQYINQDDITSMMHDLSRIEGGYSNYDEDAGGETIYGVTRKYHQNFSFWKEFDAIKQGKDFIKILNSSLSRSKKFAEITNICDRRFTVEYFDSWCEIMSKYLSFSKMPYVNDFFEEHMCFIRDSSKMKEIYSLIRPTFFLSVNAGNVKAHRILKQCLYTDLGIAEQKLAEYISEFYISIANKGRNAMFINGWRNRVILSFSSKQNITSIINNVFDTFKSSAN